MKEKGTINKYRPVEISPLSCLWSANTLLWFTDAVVLKYHATENVNVEKIKCETSF